MNGIPVGTKRKASIESSEIINGSTEENSGETDHIREEKQKRKKKKHNEKIEKENDKHGEDCIEEKKEAKKKRKHTEENLILASSLEKGGTPEEGKVESKKKKKRKSLLDNSNITTDSKNANGGNKNGVEEMVITNGYNKTEERESNKPLVNGCSENESSVLKGDTRLPLNKNDEASSRTVEKKVLRKAASFNSEPFAKFQKNATPPAFVRKCLAKTPNTEPKKTKTSSMKVSDTLFFFSVTIFIQLSI